MALPIDPATLEASDIGEQRATLEMDHEEAVEHVRETFEAAGFGVPVEFSVSEMLNEKIDAGRDPYYVLGACNPSMADRVLDASEGRVGAIMPCNVVVWEERPGVQTVYHVSIMRIGRLLGMAPDDEGMADIIAETGEMVDAAYAAL
ncbi:DUF302 domain-containing protein [Haloplanus aerogenes]|uniref:DUF302 domain-containing protein n=1 Tax=Haloplanus aerogenes TaxID=660522 RepID=A0A3M0CXM2_9EURY|nr:DUF302 domain-containing protein [Haloplanus aerogenes]AZH24916.1 DUF302 domain-containing protein [Haloplanus aerogenes]RMB13872.1 uncharacterized protein (DUF302 family) [Haloplanus aerogenes]